MSQANGNSKQRQQEDLIMARNQLVDSCARLASQMRMAAEATDKYVNLLNGADPSSIPFNLLTGSSGHAQPHQFASKDSEFQTSSAPVKKEKKIKDPNAPKRPASAYLVFQNKIRAQVKAENPDSTNNEVVAKISQKWKEMSDQEKQPYLDEITSKMSQFLEEKKAYDESGGAEASANAAKSSAPEKKKAAKPTKPVAKPVAPVEIPTPKEDDDEDEEEDGDEDSESSDDSDDSSSDSEGSEDSEEDQIESTPPPAPNKATPPAPTPSNSSISKSSKKSSSSGSGTITNTPKKKSSSTPVANTSSTSAAETSQSEAKSKKRKEKKSGEGSSAKKSKKER